ncbi:MAG: hypothetical protein Q8L46_01100, partial [candidate division WWE3 bacterium]|nr:hypothetical protein [candidate division WWE3 bacterium]
MPQGGSEQEKSGLEVKISKLESSPVLERGQVVQVFESPPLDKEEYPPERGRLFAVIDLKTDLDTDPAVAAKLVWDTLAEEYYAPENETPVSALERAVYTARDKLKDLSPTATLEFAAAAIRGSTALTTGGEVVYVARLGRPALYLRRGTEASDLLSGEEAVGVASQIVEDGDSLILGSPIFAKNFSPADLPRTEFLEKQFASGEKVAGFAAFLLKFESSRQAREEAVARSRSSRLFWGKVSRAGAWFGAQARQLAQSVRAPQSIKEKLVAAWQKRVSRGQELAQRRQLDSSQPRPPDAEPSGDAGGESVVSSQKQEHEVGASTTPLRKGFKLPKIKGLSLPRAIGILVIVLAVSVLLTTWQQAKKARAQEFERLLAGVTQSLDEAD